MKPAIQIADIDSQELTEILQRIDENINNRLKAPSTMIEEPLIPDLPQIDHTINQIHQLSQAQPPFFGVYGSLPQRAARWLLNLPLRIFMRKQAFFNKESIHISLSIVTYIQSLQEAIARIIKSVNGLTKQQSTQKNQIADIDIRLQLQEERLNQYINDQRQKTDKMILGSEILPEPYIINPEQYQKRINTYGAIRLNLGCGEKLLNDYINIDHRPLPEIDIIADIQLLPYGPASVDEIASAYLIEHFREHQFRTTILPYWKSLLKSGGILRIICPNWEAIVQHLNSGLLTWAQFKLLTFGGQDGVGDDHFAMYTPESLKQLLQSVGFISIDVVATDRMNDVCPEMEIVAYKP